MFVNGIGELPTQPLKFVVIRGQGSKRAVLTLSV